MHSEASSELEDAFPIKKSLTENAEMTPAKKVVVEQGDYLTKIIQQAYGKCNKTLMAKVLKENPEIREADQIFVGQVIKLPETDPR